MSPREKLRISLLVTVKAYPAISQRHGEVVCVAGVRTDTPKPQWVRLWPVRFRDLPFSQRFVKYQDVSLDVEASSDTRPESFRPMTDSLVAGKVVGTEKGWAKRRALIEPLVMESMCGVLEQQRRDRTSLAVFRPADVQAFLIVPDEKDWAAKKQAVIAQPSLFAPDKKELRKIPYTFKYRYRCSHRSCPGHEQSIIDWELAQAFISWANYSENERLERIRQKWVGELCAPSRDVHFFVGNQHLHPASFVVLGVFWPPKDAPVSSEQLPLILG
jgi:hypothetical protein